MADEPNKSGSWWTTLPGILTATAAVITAVTGLVAILSQTGVFGEKNKALVSQKAADVRDAVVSSATSTRPDVAIKPVETKATPSAVVNESVASGIAATPLNAVPFTGAIVMLLDGSVVKLRDDVKEYCQGRPLLKTLGGQYIEMQRIRRFELSNWTDQKGSAHIILNNGETMDVRIEGCAMVGNNDLGAYHGGFETIRAVEFVR